ncbi:MAG: cryptochrome/photolyase family protein [Beijerinckiaceae bacterium]
MVSGGRRIRNLIFILGDQLSHDIASLQGADPEQDVIFMCEVREEAAYVRHHKQKIIFILSAMRHFAAELEEEGLCVDYLKYDAQENPGDFIKAVAAAAERHRPDKIVVTEAGEWRVQQLLEAIETATGIATEIRDDDRFLCTHDEFRAWAKERKQLRMEFFYREMRKKTGYLMEGGEPAGGKWNFDHDNRKRAMPDLFMPKRREFRPDSITKNVIALVETRLAGSFGDATPFRFAVTRAEAVKALDHFIERALPCFGDFQDAMLAGEDTLYHSVLSGYINIGLLSAREVCDRVADAYAAGDVAVNCAEGFIRQIIGWREYVRGIYWLKMPDYRDENHFEARRDLPWFYWSAETKMRCMREAIVQTKEKAYAHHIQRLMVTGNFALLAGIEPRQIHEWYLAVYFDAFEWVELPNTLGMSQFADGGLLGSKPYAASGAYIDRMSDYCGGCHYDIKHKTGKGACPFNSLYWDFLVRNRNRLKANNRLARAYVNWDRMDGARQQAYRDTAAVYLETIEEL